MNKLTKLLTCTMGSLLTTLAGCDYIHDDSLARCEYRLHFVYDYNMKFADAFQHEVSQATLFLCDAEGRFLSRRDITGAELKANNIVMDLEPGTYLALTWAGLDTDSYTWPDLTPGGSTIDEIKVRTLREADGSQPDELTPLWHALDTLTIVGNDDEDKYISLAKNTNKVRLVLQDTDGNCMDARDFSFEIRADNGYMDYDNSLLPDPVISYQPYHLANVNIAEGDTLMGKPAMQTVAVAELNTMRLMDKKNYRLIVRHNAWEKDVINVNLCNYLLLTQMEGHKISAQEYLDRQDEYSIVFFLTPSYCPDCPPIEPTDPDTPVDPDEPTDPDKPVNPDKPDPIWPDIPEPEVPIVSYSCYKVQVKDWVIRINNGEL